MNEKQTKPVVYEARDGQAITLDFDTIRKYLVNGHPEFTLPKELMFFMGMCKSRGLNPFNKDCYLMKYSQRDPAAIIIARDYKRTKAQRDCKGWSYGIIVQRGDDIKYTKGLMLKDDILLGGWFRAQPEGWTEPFELEVNLNTYIKKTKDGNLTAFWKKEKQPSMIAKVAESQGLTACWPGEFGQMYIEEEIGASDMFKTTEAAAGKEVDAEWEEKKPEEEPDLFRPIYDTLTDKGVTPDQIKEFIQSVADDNNLTGLEVKESAVNDREGFINGVLNAVKLKNKMDEGDKETSGYHGLSVPSEEEQIQAAQAKLEEKRRQEQESKGDDLEKVDMIGWLKVCRPSASLKNAKETLKVFDEHDADIQCLEDRVLRKQLLNKRRKTEDYIRQSKPPTEAPQTPGAHEQAERKDAFFDYCFEADKKVQQEAPNDQLPGLIESVLAIEDYADLDSVLEIDYGKFKVMLRGEAERRGVTIET